MGFLFRFFRRNQENYKKLVELESKITHLETLLIGKILCSKDDFIAMLEDLNTKTENSPAIKIEQLQVDKIIIEKLNYSNNFGHLGIKELSGKLNIGTSYEGDFSKQISEKVNEKLGNQAKINFRTKNQ